MKYDVVLRFSLSELILCGDIDGLNDLAESKAGDTGGILSDIGYALVGISGCGGYVLIRVTGNIIMY